MNRQCPIAIPCPGGNDNPVMNLSSEANDGVSFTGVGYAYWNNLSPFGVDPNNPTNNPPSYYAQGCISTCVSAVSQVAADECAAAQAAACGSEIPPLPIPPSPPGPGGGGGGGGEPVPVPSCTIITASELPDATVGVAYAASLSYTGNFPGTLNWQVISGTLPDGLSLDPLAGTIEGTPTTAQTSNFTVMLANGQEYCTKAFQITVGVCCFSNDATLPAGNLCAYYNAILLACDGIQADPGYIIGTWTVSSGALPDGLSLDANSGNVSGTPTTPGTYTFEICLDQRYGGGS